MAKFNICNISSQFDLLYSPISTEITISLPNNWFKDAGHGIKRPAHKTSETGILSQIQSSVYV